MSRLNTHEDVKRAVRNCALALARNYDVADSGSVGMRIGQLCVDEIEKQPAIADELIKSQSCRTFVLQIVVEAADDAIREKLLHDRETATLRENLIATAAFRAGHMEAMNLIRIGGTVNDEDALAHFCASLAQKWQQGSQDVSYDEFVETALQEHYGKRTGG